MGGHDYDKGRSTRSGPSTKTGVARKVGGILKKVASGPTGPLPPSKKTGAVFGPDGTPTGAPRIYRPIGGFFGEAGVVRNVIGRGRAGTGSAGSTAAAKKQATPATPIAKKVVTIRKRT